MKLGTPSLDPQPGQKAGVNEVEGVLTESTKFTIARLLMLIMQALGQFRLSASEA